MAYTTIIFKNPNSGVIREAPVGYSWTTLFFSFLPALFRSDWKWAIIMLIIQICSLGLGSIVFSFIYNKLYIRDLIGNGFKALSIASGNIDFASGKIGMQIPML